ncbi:hypothetical protein [Limimaricola hongkongensis]|nr:hypothetical protein [Limimaricola hongkongensis]
MCPQTSPAPHALALRLPVPVPSPEALLRVRLLCVLGDARGPGGAPPAELSVRLSRLEAHLRACAFGRLRADARGLRRLASRVGLSEMARVAASVEACAVSGDAAALGATVARLGRCGTGALQALRRSG